MGTLAPTGFTVRVQDPHPLAKTLRELADGLESGHWQHESGGIKLTRYPDHDRSRELVRIDSNLVLTNK